MPEVIPFDATAIDDLVRSLGERGAALRAGLLASYVDEGDMRVAELATGDLDAARRVAHTMRSSSRVVGLTELADLFDELEVVAGPRGTPGRAPALVEQAVARYRGSAAGIRLLLAAGKPAPDSAHVPKQEGAAGAVRV